MNTLQDLPKEVPVSITTSERGRPPRLLLIAYNFPPVGGAGVQRPVKWVKNLRRFGWDVSVLTTENASVPARDESLLADIPDDVLVVRARTWEPNYQTKQQLVGASNQSSRSFLATIKSSINHVAKRAIKLALQPDPQVLWVPNAIQAGKRLLTEFEHDVILVTAPAYSSFFIGTALKRRFGLPLVLDFRDEWDMSGKYLENAQRDLISKIIQERMQHRVLRQADAVVATTKASTENLAEKLYKLNRSVTPAVTIYNGFDSEDFDDGVNSPSVGYESPIHGTKTDSSLHHTPKRFRLVYTGTLWNLTTIEPLVESVLRLNQTSPELVARLELVCVGRKTPEQRSIVERLHQTGCALNLIDYCEHSKVLGWLNSADALCLLLSDVPGAERVVPAKLFEYLASGKQMLAIAPKGETTDIAGRFQPANVIEPTNVDGIAQWLKGRLAGDARDSTRPANSADIHEYSRVAQTEKLVTLLNKLVPSHSTGRPNQ